MIRALPFTKESGVAYLRGHASSGKAWAHFELGEVYRGGKGVPQNDEEAFKQYLQAVEGGYVVATFSLASHYLCGIGVPQSTAKAIEYYKRGSDAGIGMCSYSLGCLEG